MKLSKPLFVILTCFLVFKCGRQGKDISSVGPDSAVIEAKKNYYTEKRERISEENAEPLDTVAPTREELYHKEAFAHPLRPFDLSYSEWKTIQCIVAVNEADFWNKYMIALVEKSGTLRISYSNMTLRLKPVGNVRIKPGDWSGTFKNDSIEVKLSAIFEGGQSMKRMKGHGSVVARIKNRTFEEKAFFAYEDE